jgi:hypothetical protein
MSHVKLTFLVVSLSFHLYVKAFHSDLGFVYDIKQEEPT